MNNVALEYIMYEINDYEDRQNLIRAFANAGYKVWVKHCSHLLDNHFYVCVEKP